MLKSVRRRAETGARRGGASRLPELPERADRVRAYAATAFGRVVAAAAPSPAVASGWDHVHRAAAAVDIGRARLPQRRAIGPGR
jgi:hypothetical protein